MDMTADLKSNAISLLIVPKEKYRSELPAIVKSADAVAQHICYVCINDPYNAALSRIQKAGLPANKYYFLDAVSRSAGEPTETENCTFISSPSALTELSIGLAAALGDRQCDSIFFDTLSALLVYGEPNAIIQFMHDVITKIRVKSGKGAFIALREDLETELVKDLYMFVDKVIEVG